MAKSTVSAYPKYSVNKSDHIDHLIYSDVCGPINPPTRGGKKYFVVFLDYFSRFVKVFVMENKNEVFKYVRSLKFIGKSKW